MDPIIVHRGRSVAIEVTLPNAVGGDIYTSQIRVGPSVNSSLIATWNVTVLPGRNNRTLQLTLDDSITTTITQSGGYMDLKRVSGGEPLAVFQYPIQVVFMPVVTE